MSETEKSTTSKPLSTEDAAKVKKQIEFYFSDSNYPRDKFLLETAKQNKEGYIPLEILTKFNRLKAITSDVSLIAEAISDSEVVILNDDKTLIKRKHPIPEKLNADPRTIHVRGAPKNVSLDDFEKFFSTHGKINSIRICKDKTSKKPNGFIYIEFETETDATKFAALGSIKYNDEHDMKVQKKEEYLKNKKEKLLGKRKEPEVPEYTKNIIIQFNGIPKDCEVTAIQLKEFFKTIADAQYVEFIKGDTEGNVRCNSEEEAKKLLSSTDKFRDNIEITYSLLTGEKEKMFWVRTQKSKRAPKGKRKKGRDRKSVV